jgi:2-amino-4-hydroxy-6-hydroxymethyldihydropteridine diphosphokinase
MIKEQQKKVGTGIVKKRDLLENQVKTVYLGIGSNLGNRRRNIEKAKIQLLNHDIKILRCSSNYESLSWPDISNPKFINIIIMIQTKLSPINLLKICNLIEINLGRKKSKKNAPRTCDIDIIDYSQKSLKVENSNLILPHKSMNKRSFVLIPLFEINQSWKHPKFKINIAKLINRLPIKDLRSIKQI